MRRIPQTVVVFGQAHALRIRLSAGYAFLALCFKVSLGKLLFSSSLTRAHAP